MMSTNQEFYDSIWTKAMEDRFIEEAISAKENGRWRVAPNWRNPMFVQQITPIINAEFGLSLPVAYYADKVESLFERQNTFQFRKGHYDVYWNEEANEVTMDQGTFSELATLTPLTHAYRARGEPQYRKLFALFTDDQ
ncbi:hypothetical protein C2S53_009061 [Perilla frutescens var. hirtella]|uniref:Uncharacterized protein n=1 Tax=Perilla frutescens var. hirtella TaxID=608512 RepID=A0AAD4IY45_PERFH|nr:hypothetical protein C2S53_009061 [Perilla frutescens var. hirtella]